MTGHRPPRAEGCRDERFGRERLRGRTRRIGPVGIDDIEILAASYQKRDADRCSGNFAHDESSLIAGAQNVISKLPVNVR